jgi:hypothetical protein
MLLPRLAKSLLNAQANAIERIVLGNMQCCVGFSDDIGLTNDWDQPVEGKG